MGDINADVRVVSEEVVFSGFSKVHRVRLRHRRFDGEWSAEIEREVYQRGDAAAVLLYDAARDYVGLVEQFRVAHFVRRANPWNIEIPAGGMNPGEHPEAVALRETLEETGHELQALIPIYAFYTSPGACCDKVSLYCGLYDSRQGDGVHGLGSENEDIRLTSVPFDTAWKHLEEGRIENATTIIGMQWLARNRGNRDLFGNAPAARPADR